jgi:predicted enzyme related to lactoylglutathione lyase
MRPERLDQRQTELSAVWFEVPAVNVEQAGTFYGALFGLKIGSMPGAPIVSCVNDSSVQELTARVERLGGEICLAKRTALQTGYFAICRDSAGQMFRLWEASALRSEGAIDF